MNLEEYIAKYNELKANYEKEVKSLKIEYAKTNNPYKIGDIISDHYQTIRIERVSYSEASSYRDIPSECVYKGPLLKKDGALRKDGKVSRIVQSNICETR